MKSDGSLPRVSHGAEEQELTFAARQELPGNEHGPCRYGGVPATLAPTMSTSVLQRSNIKALLIGIYHAFSVCRRLLLEVEYKMCLEKRVIAVQEKKGRKGHLSPEGTQAPSNTSAAHGKATSFNQP